MTQSVCSVNLGEKGMEALITLGAGDMRRTLNILQVAYCMLSRDKPVPPLLIQRCLAALCLS